VSGLRREPEPIRGRDDAALVVVADSLLVFRSGVRTLLAGEPDLDLAEVVDADELERVGRERQPAIALIDLNLPPDGGLAALRRLRRVCPCVAVVWSFEPTRETVVEALRAGAGGYLRKELSPEGLLRALRGVLHGEAPLARDFAALLVEELAHVRERQRARDQAAILSQREREVLELVARGASNREIADRLYIAETTVKRHLQNILGKLHLPSRATAGAFYRNAFETDEAA
jgi:DNA-binding NarL/FixJ family response regulator